MGEVYARPVGARLAREAFGASDDAFAGEPRSYGARGNSVGARLAREGILTHTKNHLGFFDIRNDFALASTNKYITSVISNGNRK